MALTDTAARLADGFTTMRTDTGTERVIILATQDTETLRAMVFAADSAGLHTDDAYTMVRDTLQQIADTEPDTISDTERDSLIDVYTHDLMPWLARNWQLADEMRTEYGDWPDNMNDLAMQTQDYAYGLVLGAIESNWPADDDTDN